ncbi:hypothetical protein HYS94_00385 [Candidatus Daviesbacteria bacterium]|nr:hypothetical protein [Candidatus Daviesbacteria bacterium]
MLPKVIIGVIFVGAIIFLGLGFLEHRDEILQNIKPKGNTPLQSLGAPSCPNPLILQTPVDLNLVTSILYPGQERGGEYKPHGGFRFDNAQNNNIEVRAPIDSELQDASRYIEQGEVQYLFEFAHPCGIRYRFDHLLILVPKFAEVVKSLPEPKEGDSRTTHVDPISVKQGEVIATAVGLKGNSNVFVDFGVYDMRGKDRFSQNPREGAICWFDLLPASDSAKVKSLPPADSVSGSQSDICK